MSNLIAMRGNLVALRGNLVQLDARKPFTFKINTIYGNGNNTFALPLTNHTTNLKIETSDGQSISITSYTDPAKLINFPSAGVYTIKMCGECGWSFNNAGDCQKLIEIRNWGNLKFNYLDYGFYGCINLTTLPDAGSINAPLITTLQALFHKCGKLKNIGSSDIFKRCLKVTSFYATFQECALTSIPVGLFDSCTLVTNFQQTFYSNQLTSLPVGLFDSCTNVTTFYLTFYNNQITSIPSGLFDSCTLVTNFQQTFYINKLTSIPVDLFRYNTRVTNYSNTFQNALASGCTMPSVMFDLSKINIVTSWQNMFNQNSTTNSPLGSVQDIWNYASAGSVKTDCFNNCTQLTNYTSIPVEWI